MRIARAPAAPSGARLTLTRETRALDLMCPYLGNTARLLTLSCGPGTRTMLEPIGGERNLITPATIAYARSEAVAWRGGHHWRIGILPP